MQIKSSSPASTPLETTHRVLCRLFVQGVWVSGDENSFILFLELRNHGPKVRSTAQRRYSPLLIPCLKSGWYCNRTRRTRYRGQGTLFFVDHSMSIVRTWRNGIWDLGGFDHFILFLGQPEPWNGGDGRELWRKSRRNLRAGVFGWIWRSSRHFAILKNNLSADI
jgi:hypothetical protein